MMKIRMKKQSHGYQPTENQMPLSDIEGKGEGRMGLSLLAGFLAGLVIGLLLDNPTAGTGFGIGFGLIGGILSDGSTRKNNETENIPASPI